MIVCARRMMGTVGQASISHNLASLPDIQIEKHIHKVNSAHEERLRRVKVSPSKAMPLIIVEAHKHYEVRRSGILQVVEERRNGNHRSHGTALCSEQEEADNNAAKRGH